MKSQEIKAGPVVLGHFPEASDSAMSQSAMESPFLYLVSNNRRIDDLLWETRHGASRRMWINPTHECLVYFPEERDGAAHPPCVPALTGRGGYAAEVEKEAETSNRLLDVRGHLVPGAEVIYIHLPLCLLSPFIPLKAPASLTFISKLSQFLTSLKTHSASLILRKGVSLFFYFFYFLVWHMPVKLIKHTQKKTPPSFVILQKSISTAAFTHETKATPWLGLHRREERQWKSFEDIIDAASQL